MAQDELGHARSTYPVLKALGVEAEEHGVDGGPRRLALLDDELPDWTSFIAANLLVDGVLTTFVSACVDSSVAPHGPARAQDPAGGGLAPRARRGVGAAAVPRRRRRARGAGRRACSTRGSTQAAGPARPTIPTSARPSSEGMLRHDASQQRERVRAWLVDLLGAEGVSIALDGADRLVALGPRDATLRTVSAAPTCPFCDAATVERVGAVGRADDHRAVALPGVRVLLRGAARGVRGRRGGAFPARVSRDGRMRPEADAPCDRTATARLEGPSSGPMVPRADPRRSWRT